MREISYHDFSDRVYGVQTKRAPLQVQLELTKLCTLKCSHCYLDDRRWKKDDSELSTEVVLRLLNHLKSRGCLWLCLTGGEAMAHSDFRVIWTKAKEMGFLLTLFTNATMIRYESAQFLSKYPPFDLEISIYGASAATYESITKIKGSFQRCIRGIQWACEAGLRVNLKTTVIKQNHHELAEMTAMAQSWGVPFKYDMFMNPGLNGEKAPCSTRIKEDAIADELTSNYDLLSDARDEAESSREMYQADKLFNCGAGESSLYITARGEMTMCLLTGHRAVQLDSNKLEQSFDEGWATFGDYRQLKRDPAAPCASCDLAFMCNNCPGFAKLETNDEQSGSVFLCKSTHLLAKKLGLDHSCSPQHFCGELVYDSRQPDLT